MPALGLAGPPATASPEGRGTGYAGLEARGAACAGPAAGTPGSLPDPSLPAPAPLAAPGWQPENPEDPPLPPGGWRAGADTLDVQHQIGDTTTVLRFEGDTLRIPYFSNRRLDETLPGIRRAVVVVHGTLRNAHAYFHAIEAAAAEVPGADTTSLLVAPQFLTEADVAADTLPDDHLFWAYMGWRQGDQSLSTVAHPRPARISSFAVIDTILLRLAQNLPDLEKIVISGHSAGGQFVNRYAAGNPVHDQLTGAWGLEVQYLFSNPSAYLYLDERRWVPGSAWSFAPPSPEQVAFCPGYDLYKYGLNDLNEYMDIGTATLRAQYSSRRVACLLGGNDNDPNSGYLEKNCEAMLQGETRLQRGLLYRRHLIDTFGMEILANHYFAIVPGVGHDQRGIFTSSCGIRVLFDYGGCTSNLPGTLWADATTEPLRAPATRTVGWADFDGTGSPDLFLAAIDSAEALLENTAGLFTDVTPPSVRDSLLAIAASWADIDRDADPDLCVVNFGSRVLLYRNDGGSFTEIAGGALTESAGVNEAAWADYDRDGDLDVFLARTRRALDLLIRNDGESGFVDATPGELPDSLDSRDACWADFDGDGDPDLLIVNLGVCRLLRNDGGSFSPQPLPAIGETGSWGSASWADYDDDGDLDLYLTCLGMPGGRLFRNDGAAGFADATTSPLDDTARAAAWGDYDNDGDLDLYLVKSQGRNRLLRNEEDGFRDVAEYPMQDGGVGMGVGWADHDADGDLDLYITNDSGWNRLLRNHAAGSNHWLQVVLAGTESNRQGIGARVRVVAGGRAQVREVGGDTGIGSQNWVVAHFGLGAASTVDTLTIVWPSGIVQTEIPGFAADRRIIVTESTEPAGAPPGPDPIGTGDGEAGLRPEDVALPNPFRNETRWEHVLAAPGPLRVEIYDAGGRRVRTLLDAARAAAGRHVLSWDGRDDGGRRLPHGVYFARVSEEQRRREIRLVRGR